MCAHHIFAFLTAQDRVVALLAAPNCSTRSHMSHTRHNVLCGAGGGAAQRLCLHARARHARTVEKKKAGYHGAHTHKMRTRVQCTQIRCCTLCIWCDVVWCMAAAAAAVRSACGVAAAVYALREVPISSSTCAWRQLQYKTAAIACLCAQEKGDQWGG